MGERAPALQAHHRRLPAEPVRPGRRGSPSRDSYFEEGGHRQLHPGGLGLPGVPDPLPVPPPQRLRAVPGRRVVLQAEERPRPRPDRDRGGPRASTRSCSSSTPTPPKAEETRARIKECRQSLARAEFLVGLLLPAHPPGLPRRDRALRGHPERLSRLRAASTRSCSGCPSASAQSGRGVEAQPHLARLQAEYPKSAHAGDATEFECDTAGAPPPRPRRRPHRDAHVPRRRPRPTAADAVSSSVTLESAKNLLTRLLFSC